MYQRLISMGLKIRPHKDSDGDIALTFSWDSHPDPCYGRWYLIANYGKYAIGVSQKRKKPYFCDYYATGCGG